MQESSTDDHFKDCLLKLLAHLEKKIKNITKTKRKKLEKLNKYLKKLVSERFDEYLGLFALPNGPSNYYGNVWLNVIKMTNLTNYNNSNIYDKEEVNLSDSVSDRLYNAASLEGNRFKANFVSPNVNNLSRRNLTKGEIFLLLKGLQFVPTSKHFNKALLKEELENVGRKLRFKCFFGNDERQFYVDSFKQKSSLILEKMMLLLNFI